LIVSRAYRKGAAYNVPMVQVFTLYRTADPESDPHSEYYSLSIFTKETFQSTPIFIRESNGFGTRLRSVQSQTSARLDLKKDSTIRKKPRSSLSVISSIEPRKASSIAFQNHHRSSR
jgi:hypothetical protein